MGRFDTTRWSLVLRARGDAADARAALEVLCRTYRPPVLAYVRSHVRARDAAEDLTQAFFTRFLERAWHAGADPERGRFRTFLLTMLKRFLIDADAEAHTLKRGGNIRFEALDEADTACAAESPEDTFEREWARAVLAAAFLRLRLEAEGVGKLALFERLSEFLTEPPDEADYARVAAELNLRRNTLAVAVHRLRHRLRDLVREELTETTSCRADMDAELRALRVALGPAPQ
ncbi:MAG TPA: sigma-70 family RNA polymerase sigma factor [Rhodanobacteraceae bacterium]|nr:sigma-70 family RNA polymerase sigma factor [Rhodanobacteraceae bacterium]